MSSCHKKTSKIKITAGDEYARPRSDPFVRWLGRVGQGKVNDIEPPVGPLQTYGNFAEDQARWPTTPTLSPDSETPIHVSNKSKYYGRLQAG